MSKRLVDKISEKFFWFFYYYGRIFGIVFFYFEKDIETGIWHIKRSSKFFTGFCLACRIGGVFSLIYTTKDFWLMPKELQNGLYKIQICGTIVSSLILLIVQIWFQESFIAFGRSLLNLHRYINNIAPSTIRFVETPFWVLLSVKWICIVYEVGSVLPLIINNPNLIKFSLAIITNLYLTAGVTISFHVAFVAYMLFGQFYSVMNRLIRDRLSPRLRLLNSKKNHNIKRLNLLTKELDEYICVFANIDKAGREFQRLFELPLSYMLLFTVSVLSVMLYGVTMKCLFTGGLDWDCVLFAAKILSDILLLTLSAHIAVKNSTLSKRNGLDSAYIRVAEQWDQTVEIFVNRLNLYEFKPNLLGLFDINNEINLMFLSAIITYLTIIIQYSLNSTITFDEEEWNQL